MKASLRARRMDRNHSYEYYCQSIGNHFHEFVMTVLLQELAITKKSVNTLLEQSRGNVVADDIKSVVSCTNGNELILQPDGFVNNSQ